MDRQLVQILRYPSRRERRIYIMLGKQKTDKILKRENEKLKMNLDNL